LGGSGGRGFERGYQVVDRGFVLRVCEGKVAAMLVQVACDCAADAAQLVSELYLRKEWLYYPPLAPVMRASLPFSSLSTATDMTGSEICCKCFEVCESLAAMLNVSFRGAGCPWSERGVHANDLSTRPGIEPAGANADSIRWNIERPGSSAVAY